MAATDVMIGYMNIYFDLHVPIRVLPLLDRGGYRHDNWKYEYLMFLFE
jgi:hypothetical protein